MGPLEGYCIIELAGVGLCPMAGMMLSDMGAEVICIERSKAQAPGRDISSRGKRSIVLDRKQPRGVETALRLLDKADALIEGYRPGKGKDFDQGVTLGPCIADLTRSQTIYPGEILGSGTVGTGCGLEHLRR